MHQFRTEQLLPITIEEAWAFFSSPLNLAVITPPELDFKVLSDVEGKEIFDGMIIEYKVRPLFGIQMHWKTVIGKVVKPSMFSDSQLKGPYSIWEHTHTFVAQGNGVLMTDVVNYKLPLGLLGKLMHTLVVRKKIEHIFEYRRKTLDKLFAK